MIKTVLAIDSSLSCPAFAVLEFNLTERAVKVLEVTHIKTSSKKSTGYRLFQIHNHAEKLLERYEFDAVIFEKGFNKFAVATQQIQRTVGMLLFTLYSKSIEDIEEIAPTSVKKLVTGDGKATKEKLAEHLIYYVGVIKYKTDDESDAVGVGIAYGKKMNWL
jgi:crossover junction endodeoxyribonuclease RuvC